MKDYANQNETHYTKFMKDFNTVFAVDKNDDEHWHTLQCPRCGGLDIDDVLIEQEINHETVGDQFVEREETWLTCARCGGIVATNP